MEEFLTLRGVALSKYRTIGAFANAMNWKRTKTSRIINELQAPSIDEAQDMAELLHIDTQEMFIQIFLPKLSIKWTSNKTT